jgi:hypothetical protein
MLLVKKELKKSIFLFNPIVVLYFVKKRLIILHFSLLYRYQSKLKNVSSFMLNGIYNFSLSEYIKTCRCGKIGGSFFFVTGSEEKGA